MGWLPVRRRTSGGRDLSGWCARKPVRGRPRARRQITDYARSHSPRSVSGRGFDSPRLHHLCLGAMAGRRSGCVFGKDAFGFGCFHFAAGSAGRRDVPRPSGSEIGLLTWARRSEGASPPAAPRRSGEEAERSGTELARGEAPFPFRGGFRGSPGRAATVGGSDRTAPVGATFGGGEPAAAPRRNGRGESGAEKSGVEPAAGGGSDRPESARGAATEVGAEGNLNASSNRRVLARDRWAGGS